MRSPRTARSLTKATAEAGLGYIGAGEDDPDAEQIFRDLWEDETQREMVIESLKADCEVMIGRLGGH